MFPAQAHWKCVLVVTFLQHRYNVPYCMFRSSFNVKCLVSGSKTMTVATLLFMLLKAHFTAFL